MFVHIYLGVNLLGQASYFSTTSDYSTSDLYSPPNAAGAKFMFLAKVLTGEYCKGRPDLKSTPYKTAREQYDSVVDNVSEPTIFAVFHNASAYPEYIIRFKRK